jgi:sortase A
MSLPAARGPLPSILRWIQYALFAGAAVSLAWCAFVLAGGWMFQHRQEHRFELLLRTRPSANGALAPTAAAGLIGRLEIPRLALSAMVMEGTGSATLRRAVGHVEGTALPGQPGNVALSGHRDTFFRPLRNIRPNDVITLTTLLGEFRYRVVSTAIVAPSDVAVLAPAANQILTLVTCYPFYYVGPAPHRFIVRAERVM